jgi:hypothetical protein
MALDFEVTSIEGLPEAIAKEYVKDEVSGKYRLDVPGVVSSSKLAEFRDNNIVLKQTLEKFKGIDPAKYSELAKLEQQVADKTLLDAGKIDEIVNGRISSMKQEYETKVGDISNALSVTSRQLEGLLIDSSVRTAAMPAEGPQALPTAVDDILLRAKTVFRIVDGVATPINDKGQVIYGANGTDPMSISEWMRGLHKTAPHLFAGSKGGGAHHQQQQHRQASGNMTAVQKISAGLQS